MKANELIKFGLKITISLISLGFALAVGREAESNYKRMWNNEEDSKNG